MKRTNNELSKHNAALEAECSQLRRASEKHAAANDALSKRHATDALHLELTQEKQRLVKQAYENNEAQRQFNAKSLSDTKRILDTALNEHRAALDAAIQKLNEERTQMKQLTEQMAEQLAAQRKDEWIEEKRQHNVQFMESMRKLNEEYDKKMQEFQREMEHQNSKLREQARVEMETTKRKMNADFMEELDNHKLKVRLELDAAISERLHDAVTSNCTHMQRMNALDFRGKRVMLYSHYSESNEVQDYNVLTIECMHHYFDYIIILTNCPNKWNMLSPNYNQCHLLNYNMKSDFRNYGVFIMQLETSLVNASRLCLINDSFIVVDVNAFSLCIKRLFDSEPMSHDFIGLTSSYENVYHLQSYFICFGSPAIPAVMSYFKTHGLPFNHADAISKYELGMSQHLTNLGFTSFASVTNNDMQCPLNTTCCKWSNVLEETGIVKRQHFLKKYAYAGMTYKDIAMIAEHHTYNKELLQFLHHCTF